MKNSKTLTYAGVIAALVAVSYLYSQRKESESEGSFIAPPGKANSLAGDTTSPIPLSDPQLQAAIKQKIKFIVRNDNLREAAYEAQGVRKGIFSGLQYGNGIRQALAASLPDGNPNNVPVIPVSYDRTYSDRLELIQNLQDYGRINDTVGTEAARQQWQSASDMGDAGFSFWPPNMVQLIDQGAFFVSGPKDKDKSERYDSWSKDMKKLSENLLTANRKAGDALEQAAITQLIDDGWKIVGFSYS